MRNGGFEYPSAERGAGRARRRGFGILLACLFAMAVPARGQLLLIKDGNTLPQERAFGAGLAIAGTFYFSLPGTGGESELWKSDGTARGTGPVKDIFPGACGSSPAAFAAAGQVLIFSADDGVYGRELWRSDGSAAGTFMLRDIRSGHAGSNPAAIGTSNGIAYMAADNGVDGVGIWRSDGTAPGTYQLKSIAGEAGGQPAARAAELDGRMFIAARSGSAAQLWKTDGSRAGTALLMEAWPPWQPTRIVTMGTHLKKLYFLLERTEIASLQTPDGLPRCDYELWVSDGSSAGTGAVATLAHWSAPLEADQPPMVSCGNKLIFALNGAGTTDLWVSDGTARGTLRIKSIARAAGAQTTRLAPWGAKTYFIANGDAWRTDGTSAGTLLCRSFPYGAVAADPFVPLEGRLFFLMKGKQLWTIDPETDVTTLTENLLKEQEAYAAACLTRLNDGMVFSALSWGQGFSLWRRPAGGGSGLVCKFPTPTCGTLIDRMMEYKGRLVYTKGGGSVLESSDGTAAGTGPATGLIPNGVLSPAHVTLDLPLAECRGRTIFIGYDGEHGREPWVSDGTTSGTHVLVDIIPGSQSSYPATLVVCGNRVYFPAANKLGVWSLWLTNGTPQGTPAVRASRAPRPDLPLTDFLPLSPLIYYLCDGALWRSDGSDPGTFAIAQTPAGNPAAAGAPCALGGRAVFAAWTSAQGREPWITNGTAAGTARIRDIRPGTGSSDPREFTLFNGAIYFSADDGIGGRELWCIDSSGGGAKRVADVLPGAGGSDPRKLTAAGGALYFLATETGGAKALWKSDGTAAGTVRLKTLAANSNGPEPEHPTAFQNKLFFFYDDGQHGTELWVSDGSLYGTRMVQDLWPGPRGSYAGHGPVVAGGKLFVLADDGFHGSELYTLSANFKLSAVGDWEGYR